MKVRRTAEQLKVYEEIKKFISSDEGRAYLSEVPLRVDISDENKKKMQIKYEKMLRNRPVMR